MAVVHIEVPMGLFAPPPALREEFEERRREWVNVRFGSPSALVLA